MIDVTFMKKQKNRDEQHALTSILAQSETGNDMGETSVHAVWWPGARAQQAYVGNRRQGD